MNTSVKISGRNLDQIGLETRPRHKSHTFEASTKSNQNLQQEL